MLPMELISGAGALSLPGGGGTSWTEHLRVPDLSVGTYCISVGGTDPQEPHTEDEVYVITAGQAVLVAGADGAQRAAVSPGSVAYVPAGEVHHFTEITADLCAIVIFAPSEESRAHPDAAAAGASGAG
jgi:mannose-6-phosphate isomerase-like protein (cupin superfamily)